MTLSLSDRELAAAWTQARDLEQRLRAYVQTEDLSERDAATNVLRVTIPLRRNIETWIALRGLRAQLAVSK